MVQLNLPRGSKPTTGKVHKAPAGAKNVKTYKVYRYDPEVDPTRAGTSMRSRPMITGRCSWTP